MTIPATILLMLVAAFVAHLVGYTQGIQRGRVLQAALMRDARGANSKAAKHLAQQRDARSAR